MENNYIKRINTIGKVGKIIVIIMEAVIICGIISAIVSGIGFLTIPDDFVTINGKASAEIVIDTEKAPLMFDVDDFKDVDGMEPFKGKFKGLSFNIAFEEPSEDIVSINIAGDADSVNAKDYAWMAAMATFLGAFVLASVLVITIFGYKLAKAFSVCSSPFEENVIKRMKHFGFSLIPWAIITCISSDCISVTALLFTIVIILFTQIFAYGSKLQQENDDTV